MTCGIVWKQGKRAIAGSHKGLVPNSTYRSADIDQDLSARYPADPRWDYVLERRDRTRAAVEVHGARESQVRVLIAKKQWAVRVLRAHGDGAPLPDRWYWLLPAGSRMGITHNGPGARLLSENGIAFPARRVPDAL